MLNNKYGKLNVFTHLYKSGHICLCCVLKNIKFYWIVYKISLICIDNILHR